MWPMLTGHFYGGYWKRVLVDKVSSKYQCFLYTKVTLRRSLNLSSPNAPKVQPDRGNESIVPLWTSNLAAREVPVVCGKIWKNGKRGILGQFMLICWLLWFLCSCSMFHPRLWCFFRWGFWGYFLLTFTSLGLFRASDFMWGSVHSGSVDVWCLDCDDCACLLYIFSP